MASRKIHKGAVVGLWSSVTRVDDPWVETKIPTLSFAENGKDEGGAPGVFFLFICLVPWEICAARFLYPL